MRGQGVRVWAKWSVGAVNRYAVAADEWVWIEAGYVATVGPVAALLVDGVVRLDGVLHV